jgi:hypothetical protein
MLDNLKPENREYAPLMDLLSTPSRTGSGGGGVGHTFKIQMRACSALPAEICTYVTTGTEPSNFQHQIKILKKGH